MTDEERALQMARREGFVEALINIGRTREWAIEQAASHYPLTVTRPRVVRTDSGKEFRVVDGVLEQRYRSDTEWFKWNVSTAAIRDLLENPTETVTE